MSTLLLRLAAPLQSWGVDSKYEQRRTGTLPSKSAVVGLLAAALGRRRDEPPDDLNALRFGVRVDQPGELLRDYHTAKKGNKPPYVTQRYYIADAVFVAGLESPNEGFLQMLADALRNPRFPLFLGRRSCPPTLPLVIGVCQEALLGALKNAPWQASDWRRTKLDAELRLQVDASGQARSAACCDLPLTFDPAHRQYGYRLVCEQGYVSVAGDRMEHDPFTELR